MAQTVTHTLDWDHIFPTGKQGGVRLYLHIESDEVELVRIERFREDGTLGLLTRSNYMDVERSFQDNLDSGYNFISEADIAQEGH